MEISSGDTGILLPLVSFNLGIESGQLAVAVVILPMIWWLNNKVEITEKFFEALRDGGQFDGYILAAGKNRSIIDRLKRTVFQSAFPVR